MKNTNTRKLTESAIMIALAIVLSLFAVFKLPNGGSITVASMAPIMIIAYKYGARWGTFAALTYSLLQMVLGFYPPPVQTLTYFILVILLDYVIAFGVLGLFPLFTKLFSNQVLGVGVSTALTVFLRFLCHFLSGILIWNIYAPEGQPVWLYSLTYNGSYMLGEMIITTVAMALLQYKSLLKRIAPSNAQA